MPNLIMEAPSLAVNFLPIHVTTPCCVWLIRFYTRYCAFQVAMHKKWC